MYLRGRSRWKVMMLLEVYFVRIYLCFLLFIVFWILYSDMLYNCRFFVIMCCFFIGIKMVGKIFYVIKVLYLLKNVYFFVILIILSI